MPKRPCLGCGQPTTRPDSRCPACAGAHNRSRDARRGSRHDRGYGTDHDRIRTQLLAQLKPGQLCPRCSQPMTADQDLHAGHPIGRPLRVDTTSRADHLEHSWCNEGAND